MISIIDSGKLVNTEVSPMVPRSCEMVGLSTDTKPTGMSVGNGWSFIEMDTGKVFFYDAESENWLEFAGSGGGGGQGGSNVLVVNCDTSTNTLDKTWQEIFDAPFAVIKFVQGNNRMNYYIASVVAAGSMYAVIVFEESESNISELVFVTDSADGYPVIEST